VKVLHHQSVVLWTPCELHHLAFSRLLEQQPELEKPCVPETSHNCRQHKLQERRLKNTATTKEKMKRTMKPTVKRNLIPNAASYIVVAMVKEKANKQRLWRSKIRVLHQKER
jgi:hypothetical protein